MATKLKNLKVHKVDFVDAGANPDAHIGLFKSKNRDAPAAGAAEGAAGAAGAGAKASYSSVSMALPASTSTS